MAAKTSLTHPLQIGYVTAPAGTGQIGVTFCPGKKQADAVSGVWDRDLALDLDLLRDHQAAALLTLVEDWELEALQVLPLGDMARERGIEWYHLPIKDWHTPTLDWETGWMQIGSRLRAHVDAGRRVIVHCKGGLGRAGTIACRLLIDLGMSADAAMQQVRLVRKGAVENEQQERYVIGLDRVGRAEKLAGGIFGALVGDALGVPYEFKSPSSLPALSAIEMTPPAGFRRTWPGIPAGTWSDDGALSLCLLASLNSTGRFDLDDFAQRMVRWWNNGYMAVDGEVFDVGNATRSGLQRVASGTPAAHAGATDDQSNGNGALMRVLPLALWHTGSDAELVRDARASSLPTHGHLRSQLCCALYCLYARHMLDEQTDAWARSVNTLKSFYAEGTPERRELDERILSFADSDCCGSGYVVDSLHCARLLLEAPDYETAMKRAIAYGNDTDTTACIAGGLAGIRWGLRGIPARWLITLRERDVAHAEVAVLIRYRCGA